MHPESLRDKIRPKWPIKGQNWPELARTGRTSIFELDTSNLRQRKICASRKRAGLNLTYLASKEPDLASDGQYWPELAEPQFSSSNSCHQESLRD